jgi:hypothetical protein
MRINENNRAIGIQVWFSCSVVYTATTMIDLRNYSKQFIEEFINMYREFPCLWRIKSKQYSNRNLRNEAYEKLVAKLKEIEPEANKEMVIKKINTLRTAFRREMKKVKEGTHSGMGSDDVYEPRLWYYPLLYFTVEQETQREGQSNVEEDDLDKEAQEENTVEEPVNVTNQVRICKKTTDNTIQDYNN